MTLVATPFGLIWPIGASQQITATATTVGTMDLTAEKIAFSGYIYMADRSASAKTLSAAGGGSIAFRTGVVTWAGTSTLVIGLQDFNTGTGPAGQPDGTFDVSRTLTAPSGLTTTAWNTISMTGGSGTKTLTHGDLVSIVFDMTLRNGSDSVILQAMSGSNNNIKTGLPNCNTFTAAAWGALSPNSTPNVVIAFDDGTLGILGGSSPWSAYALESYQDSSTPDERGMLFQVPWDCKIDALWAQTGGLVNGNFTIALWSAPTTAAAAVSGTSFTVPASMLGGNADLLCFFQLPTEVSLSRNTDYVVALKATGAANLRLSTGILGAEAHRAFLPGGTTIAKATRTGGTGNFAAETPAITMMNCGVRISQFHDGAGGGSAGVVGG